MIHQNIVIHINNLSQQPAFAGFFVYTAFTHESSTDFIFLNEQSKNLFCN